VNAHPGTQSFYEILPLVVKQLIWELHAKDYFSLKLYRKFSSCASNAPQSLAYGHNTALFPIFSPKSQK
jgi:hypothetical protein